MNEGADPKPHKEKSICHKERYSPTWSEFSESADESSSRCSSRLSTLKEYANVVKIAKQKHKESNSLSPLNTQFTMNDTAPSPRKKYNLRNLLQLAKNKEASNQLISKVRSDDGNSSEDTYSTIVTSSRNEINNECSKIKKPSSQQFSSTVFREGTNRENYDTTKSTIHHSSKEIESDDSRNSPSQLISHCAKSFNVTNGKIVNECNLTEDEYSIRSIRPLRIQSYENYCNIKKKNPIEDKIITTEFVNEVTEQLSPEWDRYRMYTRNQKEISVKVDSAKMTGCQKNSNAVLKPIPPQFSGNVTIDSIMESQQAHSENNTNDERHYNGGKPSDHIHAEDVVSFIRHEQPSIKNAYALHQIPEANRNSLIPKQNLCSLDIPNVICLGNHVPSPSLKIKDYCFEGRILKAFEVCEITNPTVLQSYMWPVLLRGYNCVAVGLKGAGKSWGYAIPILNEFSPEKYEDLPPGPGPLVIILCSNWMVCQKVQEDFDKCAQFSNIFNIITVHGGDDVRKKMTELLKGYKVLITTPTVILKLMKNDMGVNIIERCCHLILDDADCLIEIFHNEILEFLPEYRKVFIRRGKNTLSPNQFVVCSTTWTAGVKSFVRWISNPVLLFSNFLEAAIQAEIPFYTHVCEQYQEVFTIAGLLGQKSNCNVVICCTDSKCVQNLARILNTHSFHFLTAHEQMNKPDLDNVKRQWKASTDCSNHPVLIVSDVILPLIEISNAECLIHYNLPDLSKLQFSNRFSCLKDVISFWHNASINNPEKVVKASLKECTNFVVINEKNTHQSYELMRIMHRLNCPIPKSLSKLAQTELMTRKLCDSLLAFGKCQMKEICRRRHVFHPFVDKPTEGIPHFGIVDLLITYVVNAGLYYGNILKYVDPNSGQEVTKDREQFLQLNMDITLYFQKNKVKEIMTEDQGNNIFAFRGVGGAYFRVKIKEILPAKYGYTRKATIISIDEGWTRTVELECIFKLPEEFAIFPPQAVQIRLCKIKPLDGSDVWTNQANTFANDLVKNKELTGNVLLSFHNCIFVANLKPNSNASISDTNSSYISIVSRLKSANFAVSNLKHVESLIQQCKGIISWASQQPEMKVNSSSLVKYENFELNVSKAVYLSSVQSPSLFYAIPVETYNNLLDLNDKINQHLVEGKLKRIENLRKNALVLGPYVEEQRWYRARITDVIKNKETVVRLFFPDFGDECSAVGNDIYEIPLDLLECLPFQAVECSLSGIRPTHGGWSQLAIDSFSDSTRADDDDSVFIKFSLEASQTSPAVNSNAKHYRVSLYFENGSSLAEDFIKRGLAEDPNKPDLAAVSSTEYSNDCYNCGSADELERECQNNYNMILNGFDPKYVEEIRGYKLSVNSGPPLRAIENKSDEIETSKANATEANTKSAEFKNIDPIPTLLVCNDIPRSQPKTTWFQTDKLVIVHFELICSEYFGDIGTNFLSFRTIHGSKFYDFRENLYSDIIPQYSTSEQMAFYAKFCLKKAENGVHWPRLIKSLEKKSHITLNFDHIDDNECAVALPQKTLRYKVNEYVKNYESSDNSSESEDVLIDEFEDI